MKGPDSIWRFGRDRADASHGRDPTEVLVQQLGGWTRRQKVHLAIWIVALAVMARRGHGGAASGADAHARRTRRARRGR